MNSFNCMRCRICLKVSDNDECFIDTLLVSTCSRLWVLKHFESRKHVFREHYLQSIASSSQRLMTLSLQLLGNSSSWKGDIETEEIH